jgi:hypothetical protein
VPAQWRSSSADVGIPIDIRERQRDADCGQLDVRAHIVEETLGEAPFLDPIS